MDDKIIIADGAMGTMLQKRGLKPGSMPDLMNLSSPDVVEEVHRLYIEAGSDIICTNTFGANRYGLREVNYTPEDIISKAVNIAKNAIKNADISDGKKSEIKIALDIGPIGILLEPFGDLKSEEATDVFAEQAIVGEKAGADIVIIETMGDLNEMKAAIRAVTQNTKLPVVASMTFDVSGRTYMGVVAEDFISSAEELGVAVIGINCSLEPKEMYPVAERFAKAAKVPLIFKLNAGLPDGDTGHYHVGPAEFALQMKPYGDLGMKIVGGCCGTSPEYIKELRKIFSGG